MKRPRTVLLLGLCLILVLSFILAACGNGEGDDALLGVWTDPTGAIEFEFKSDGTVLIRAMGQEEQATYTAKDGKLSAPDPETGESNEVDYTVDGDTLILGADGEEGTLIRKQ